MTRTIDADALIKTLNEQNIPVDVRVNYEIMNAPTIEPNGDIINQIAEAIKAEIHEAWTESDADFIRGMEYAISIVRALDIRTDSDLISRQDAIKRFGEDGTWLERQGVTALTMVEAKQRAVDILESLPSAETHDIRTETHGVCSDLISRQDAIDAFGLSEKTRKYGGDHSGYNTMMLYEIQDVLESLPSAPDSRHRGEWVRKYDGHINCYWYECDQCGEYRPRNQFGHEYNANFCPNCGADMRGEEE